MSKKEPQTIAVSLKMPKDIYDKIKNMADKNYRSFTKEMILAAENHANN